MSLFSGESRRILVVEDYEPNRRLLVAQLERDGFASAAAEDARQARRLLAEQRFDLVLCDFDLPGESGLSLARWIVDSVEDTAVVMVSAEDDPDLTSTAIRIGAYGYLVKPYRPHELMINVENALRRRDIELENKRYRRYLEREVLERTAEVRATQEETIRRLAAAVESRDAPTGRHLERMGTYCGLLARRAGLGAERSAEIALASVLHDVGKLATPDDILRKRGPLTTRERLVIERHPLLGHEMLSGSRSMLLEFAAAIALTHHERIDGSGYPNGLCGEEIPVEGHIAAICDVYDALVTERPYRAALPREEALRLMRAERGTKFDPRLLDFFFDVVADERAELPLAALTRIAVVA